MSSSIRLEREARSGAQTRRGRRPGWRVRAVAPLLVLLALLGASVGPAAADDEFEAPTVLPSVPATGSMPNAIIIRWSHSGQGLSDFSVERESPPRGWDNVNAAQRDLLDTGLQPDTTYRYRVCAYLTTEDGDTACSDWTEGRTSSPVVETPPQRPSRPRVVEHHAGETWIGIKWEAGYDYDSYFINITGPFGTEKGQRELRTIHHDDDGTWGYQRVDGLLPGRSYSFSVQGCTETFFGIGSDNCWDWAPEYQATTVAQPLHSGADTCAPPYVWREAFPGDVVCVEVHRREQAARDNAAAQSRRAYQCTPPNCTFTAPDNCKVPYVWREARPEDHVCVTVAERTQVAKENGLANQRRAVPR